MYPPNARHWLVGAIAACLVLGLAVAAEEQGHAYALLEMSILTIEDGDYERFIRLCAEGLRREISRENFDKVHRQLSSRFTHDWSSHAAGTLKQHDCDVSLWIISFKDGGDDLLFKLTIKDGKLAGFVIE